MKRSVFTLAAVLALLAANAQKVKEKEVPLLVRDAFSKAHPQVKDVEWEKENGNYEAGFAAGKMEQSVLIDGSGKIIETEVEIPAADLPEAAKSYVIRNHDNAGIKEAARITDAVGNITYEAELKGGDLIFDKHGAFIKQIKK